MKRTFGWLSHWGGLHRKRADRLDVTLGRLTCVASLMAANPGHAPLGEECKGSRAIVARSILT
ncbi:hypothetical protein [Methylobacterium sp.]|uniref:hypothetical protein n=1 Tax=Methylobacterium sp. TaxID=409 RepID=UPI003B00764E